MDRNKIIRRTLIILAAVILAAGGVIGTYFLWEKPPEARPASRITQESEQTAAEIAALLMQAAVNEVWPEK